MTSTLSPAASGPHPRPERSTAGPLRSLELPGPCGRLEAVVNEGSPDARFAGLVCHPHPLFGGNLHNRVVYHAMKAMNDPAWGLGWPVLRFNFRGIRMSQGVHHGQAESADVAAAMGWLASAYRLPLVLAGFSFGAAMAVKALGEAGAGAGLSGARGERVRALVALGLPTDADGRKYEYPALAECPVPKLFLSGDRDEFAPAAELAEVAASAAEPKHLLLVPGGDHFFTGQLEKMQEALSGWLKEQLA